MAEDDRLSEKAKAFSIDAILNRPPTAEGAVLEDRSVEEVTRRGSTMPFEEENSKEVEIPDDRTRSGLTSARCSLEMKDLWRKFYDLGTEMIITKSGRRMFPSLRVSFGNLEPEATYAVAMDIGLVDNKRYRYAYHRSSWLVAGRADPPLSRRCYVHPDGPFRGAQLVKQSLSFEKVKLTNNSYDKWGYVVLNSMHKYQPRIHLIKYSGEVPNINVTSDLKKYEHKTFTFPETVFIGVTAYQNQLITKLKIDSNPFAKGFRDSARITQLDRESVDLLIKAAREGNFYSPSPESIADALTPASSVAAGNSTESMSTRLDSLSRAYSRTTKELPAELLGYYYQAYHLQALNSTARTAVCDKVMRYNPYSYNAS